MNIYWVFEIIILRIMANFPKAWWSNKEMEEKERGKNVCEQDREMKIDSDWELTEKILSKHIFNKAFCKNLRAMFPAVG